MLVFDVSKQRRVALVFLTAWASVAEVGGGCGALGLDAKMIFHWISTVYIIIIEVFPRISCILSRRMIEDCNLLFFRGLRDRRALGWSRCMY